MKRIVLIQFILLSQLTLAQKGFYLGAQTNFGFNSAVNKEDAKAGDRLKKKSNLTVGYGIAIGYGLNSRLSIGLEPSYSKFSFDFNGQCDTGQVLKVRSEHRYQFVNLPLLVKMNLIQKNRFELNASLGVSLLYLLRYQEEVYEYPSFNPTKEDVYLNYDINSYYVVYNNKKDTSFAFYDSDLYKRINYGLIFRLGMGLCLSDQLKLNAGLNYQITLNDFENKNEEMTGYGYYAYDKDTHIPIKHYPWNYKYQRYYQRPASVPERPITLLSSRTFSIGIQYFFKGGLLPSIH